MKKYGLPYMGSKNKIASQIVDLFPKKKNFYDLFCGGCAVTHAALLDGRFENYIINDIQGDVPRLFCDAIAGRYSDKKRWISREDFYRLKDNDAYIRFLWSFGNSGFEYMYSREVEPWKEALHYARVLKDFSKFEAFEIKTDASSADIIKNEAEYKVKYVKWYLKNKLLSDEDFDVLSKNLKENICKNEEELRSYLCDALKKSGLTQAEVGRRLGTQMERHYFAKSQWEFPTREMYDRMREFLPLDKSYDEIYGLQNLLESLQSLQRLQSLESLESLQSLESLESLGRLQKLQKSYKDVEILPDSVIYCDIPYEGTAEYTTESFDYAAFYSWCENQNEPLFISSYNLPSDRFICIKEISHTCALQGGSKDVTERVFIPVHQQELYFRQLEETVLFPELYI